MCTTVVSEIRSNYRNANASELQGIKDIKAAADKVLGLLGDGRDIFPIKIIELSKRIGFEVYWATFKNTNQSGLIAVDNSLPEQNDMFKSHKAILVNLDDSTSHQRFTIAHEIAHYIFDYEEDRAPIYYEAYIADGNPEDVTDPKELRANRFAAELLMPENEFKSRFMEIRSAQGEIYSLPDTISELVKHFDVPAKAVEIRLKETGLEFA